MKTKKNEIIEPVWTYATVAQLCKLYPALNYGGVRWQIFNEKTNGLAESGAITRKGRKILVHVPRYFAWIEGQNQGVAA